MAHLNTQRGNMKLSKKPIYFSILVLSASSASAATLTSMTKAQIENAVINKTLVSIPTDNLNGKTINNTFSMYLDGKGHIYGKMAHKPDGELQADQGVYTLKDDGTVTITWNHWDKKETLYAQLFETKNAYLAIDNNNVFHTVYMKESILSGNKITPSPYLKISDLNPLAKLPLK